jgi:hypothetical protein
MALIRGGPCPHCPPGRGKIVDATAVWDESRPAGWRRRTRRQLKGTRYLCDQGHQWMEPFGGRRRSTPSP